jgi:glycosyltransferase involved in cell wall biosynthesis
MKISIVTVVYNNAATIAHTIESVLAQDYTNIEYIIVDGLSTDGTVEIIEQFDDRIAKFVSEKDAGIYDAMNKGIRMATGEVIGILNADDYFNDSSTISSIAAAFKSDKTLDATIADIVFIKNEDQYKVLRHYSARKWRPAKFAWGYMPPHPSFFCKRELFDRLGYYKTDYRIAADYELLIRFLLVNKARFRYLPIVTTRMRMGGASTKNLNSIITLNAEIKRGCDENKVYTNYLMIYSKYFKKPFEFLFNG